MINWSLTPILAILWHEQILQIKTTQIQDFLNKLETCVNKILNNLESCINQILCQHIKYVR